MPNRGPKARTVKNSRRKPKAASPEASFSTPTDFDPVALGEYQRLSGELERRGLLCRTDPRIICLAAEYFSLIERARGELKGAKLALPTSNGMHQPNPLLKAIVHLSSALRGLLNDMGLTPKSSKAKPSDAVPEVAAASDWDGTLNVAG